MRNKIRQIILGMLCASALFFSGCGSSGPSELETARDAGISYMEQAQYEEAVSSFELAYSLCDEKMPQTKTDICLYEASCQLKLADYDGVRTSCTRALVEEENADAYYMRGAAELQLGETDAAKADFDCASELAPDNYTMFLNIYQQYESISQSAVGDEYLQKALNYEGTDTEDYYQKGSIYYYLGDYAKAQEMLAKPVEEKDEQSMILMGEVYLAQGDTVQARNVYQQYLTAYGNTALAYNGLALCEIAEGAYDTALTDIQNGLGLAESDSEKRDLLYNEIVAYEKKLDFDTAKQKAAEFVELYPGDEEGQKEYEFLSTR